MCRDLDMRSGRRAAKFARWVLPDAGRYLTYWPQFVSALAGNAFANGTADSIGDCGGVALWLPPDVGSDGEAMATIAADG
jgi:hypothetical protein